MEIIKMGKKEKEKEINFKCDKCDCLFKMTKKELKNFPTTKWKLSEEPSLLAFGAGSDFYKEKYYLIKCPCCNNQIEYLKNREYITWKSHSRSYQIYENFERGLYEHI